MNLFDIVGPVMVGPSSSHTAGAVRIGFVAQKLLGEPVKRARIGLYADRSQLYCFPVRKVHRLWVSDCRMATHGF